MKDLAPERPFKPGANEDDALWLAREWARAVRRDPPPSGDFLAMDLNYIANELEELRKLRDELWEIVKPLKCGNVCR
jgi:hypothetical protein